MTDIKEAPATTWENDPDFEDTTVKKVTAREDGYEIQRADGWLCWLSKEYGVEPKEGQSIRFYGRGIGARIRGIAVDGKLAFYRNAEDDENHFKDEMYGATAADWLKKWDAGDGVWTVKVGGLSAGYDQAINIMTAEFVRALLKLKPEIGDELEQEVRNALENETREAARLLGLSGAQHGAALGLAVRFYKFGPRTIIESAGDDRRTQASKRFPSLDELTLRDRIRMRIAALKEDKITGDDLVAAQLYALEAVLKE